MDGLARVLLHVQARYSDLDVSARRVLADRDGSSSRERLIELRYLITLRKVGIEIILAREYRDRIDSASEPERRSRRQLDSPLVQNRQCARQGQANGAGVDVGWRAEIRRAAAERLRASLELDVHLEPDDHLVTSAAHWCAPAPSAASSA